MANAGSQVARTIFFLIGLLLAIVGGLLLAQDLTDETEEMAAGAVALSVGLVNLACGALARAPRWALLTAIGGDVIVLAFLAYTFSTVSQ